jgi:WD40 repeat protein
VTGGHAGDVFACAFTGDSTAVLSAGWDGWIRQWDPGSGDEIGGLQVGARPLSACTLTPDGKHWVAGSMDGMVSHWDPATRTLEHTFLAHTRPVSSIRYSPEHTHLATASWDRHVILWEVERDRPGKSLGSHGDIVAGCQFTPDGKRLVSWSYDTVCAVWELGRTRPQFEFHGHQDRVTAGGVSPDARWFASGSRDGELRLWDLHHGREVGCAPLRGEVRACLFLLDAETLLAADAAGRLTLHRVPTLEVVSELESGVPVQCVELSPSGGLLALGSPNGRVSLVAVEGFDSAPLVVTATRSLRAVAGMLSRWLGKVKTTAVYECVCPACRQSFELPGEAPDRPTPCPNCRRHVRACLVTQAAEAVVSS